MAEEKFEPPSDSGSISTIGPVKITSICIAYGLGAVLLQQNEKRSRNSVSFTSCQLQKAELTYAAQKKEGFAVVHAQKNWRHHLYDE